MMNTTPRNETYDLRLDDVEGQSDMDISEGGQDLMDVEYEEQSQEKDRRSFVPQDEPSSTSSVRPCSLCLDRVNAYVRARLDQL